MIVQIHILGTSWRWLWWRCNTRWAQVYHFSITIITMIIIIIRKIFIIITTAMVTIVKIFIAYSINSNILAFYSNIIMRNLTIITFFRFLVVHHSVYMVRKTWISLELCQNKNWSNTTCKDDISYYVTYSYLWWSLTLDGTYCRL